MSDKKTMNLFNFQCLTAFVTLFEHVIINVLLFGIQRCELCDSCVGWSLFLLWPLKNNNMYFFYLSA